MNNPISFFDENGEEPNQVQAASPEEIATVVKNNRNPDVTNLSFILLTYKDAFYGDPAQPRYVFSKKGENWIDMKHFFLMAGVDRSLQEHGVPNGFSRGATNILGYAIEYYQEWNDDKSAFSGEDLFSNQKGIEFNSYLDNYIDEEGNLTKSLDTILLEYFEILECVYPTDDATNYYTLPYGDPNGGN